jgi:hypothetical protein
MKFNIIRRSPFGALCIAIGIILLGGMVWCLVTGKIKHRIGTFPSTPFTTYTPHSDPAGFYWSIGKVGLAGIGFIAMGLYVYKKDS